MVLADPENTIQSPHGGTKIAWGGPPVAPAVGKNRQRFDLVTVVGDQPAEVDRLGLLGATRLDFAGDGGNALADPDGNLFRLISEWSPAASASGGGRHRA